MDESRKLGNGIEKIRRKPTVTDVKRDRRCGAVGVRVVAAAAAAVVAVPVARRCGGGGSDSHLPPAKRCSATFKMAGGGFNRRPPKKARQIQNRPRPKTDAALIFKSRPPGFMP